jgi:rhodanese-related sulfurtransferase
VTRIVAAALKQAIRARDRELAILDAREEGEFHQSHLFWAANLPLSRLELRARPLLPNPRVPIVVCDDAGGLAERAAARLAAMGYTDIAVLDGGTQAWQAAGGELFSGVNVPSKAFGEWVEHAYGTPSIDAPDLARLKADGTDHIILDSRPIDEFSRMTIPGAVNVPGGELAFRIGDLAPKPETLVVVTCAGRTRSIMGAESLRVAGVPNRVVALRNGTMGFELAGFTCDRGARRRFADGMPANAAAARATAVRLAAAHGVGAVDAATAAAWLADPARTTYLLDVRDEAEVLMGHLPGSRHAPGGQLVQTTDHWIGVLGARIVLVDQDGVRGRMTGQWLAQMGHRDVHVLEAAAADLTGRGRVRDAIPELDAVQVETITPEALSGALERGEAVAVDVSLSVQFRAGHIAGALWAIRTRLGAIAGHIASRHVVLVSPDGDLARLAVDEARGLGAASVRVLAGGLVAWRKVGLKLVADRANPPDAACVDYSLRPYDRNDGVEDAMNAYLTWEIALPEQVARDGDVVFGPRR